MCNYRKGLIGTDTKSDPALDERQVFICSVMTRYYTGIHPCQRRINTEETAKVVTAVRGAEIIHFLAAL